MSPAPVPPVVTELSLNIPAEVVAVPLFITIPSLNAKAELFLVK